MFKLVVAFIGVAVASANPIGLWGAGLATPLATSWATPWSAGIATPLASPAVSNYRGPLSLAPGQPANILGADGRPLDTLSVNLDRAAHYTAKALEGNGHLLKKRSIFGAPLAITTLAAGPLATAPLTAIPLASSLAWSPSVGWASHAPFAPLGLGSTLW